MDTVLHFVYDRPELSVCNALDEVTCTIRTYVYIASIYYSLLRIKMI
jgi:hypothetical protein